MLRNTNSPKSNTDFFTSQHFELMSEYFSPTYAVELYAMTKTQIRAEGRDKCLINFREENLRRFIKEESPTGWPKPSSRSDTEEAPATSSPLHVPAASRSLRGFSPRFSRMSFFFYGGEVTNIWTDRQISLCIEIWLASHRLLMSFPFPGARRTLTLLPAGRRERE